MKKIMKIFGFLLLLGLIVNGLQWSGVIEFQNGPTKEQEIARDQLIADWDRLVGKKAELMDETLVVYVTNNTNPFANTDDFAMEYHPKTVNGQSCSSLGLKYIQVRNIASNKLLSGISC